MQVSHILLESLCVDGELLFFVCCSVANCSGGLESVMMLEAEAGGGFELRLDGLWWGMHGWSC